MQQSHPLISLAVRSETNLSHGVSLGPGAGHCPYAELATVRAKDDEVRLYILQCILLSKEGQPYVADVCLAVLLIDLWTYEFGHTGVLGAGYNIAGGRAVAVRLCIRTAAPRLR